MAVFLLALLFALNPIAEIARDAGHVGAAAAIIGGKEVVAFHSRERFPMQSVYKLPISMAVLAEVDRGRLRLSQDIHVDSAEYVPAGLHSPLRDSHPGGADVKLHELVRLAVSESDGSASDVLLRLIGGPPAVMRFLQTIGIRDLVVRDTEMELSRDWSAQYANYTTPESAVALLRALQESRGLSSASRGLLLRFMTETTTFPTRIKGLLPPGTVVAHKSGSSGARNGIAAATNDIGIVTLSDGRLLAIAVLISDSRAGDTERDRVIARIAQFAWERAQR